MNDISLPNYTLRLHKGEVTCLRIINDTDNFDVPILLSTDVNGLIIVWNLITRRPIFIYEIERTPHIVTFEYIESQKLYAFLSKDHKLRIYKLNRDQSDVNLPITFEPAFEVPVNTLNFANFAIEKLVGTNNDEFRLVCCNTQDAEGIDIYNLKLYEHNSLKRLRKNLNFYDIVHSFLQDSELFKFDKLGIVMKFIPYENGIIFVGFESGFIIGFKLHETPIENDMKSSSNTQSKIFEPLTDSPSLNSSTLHNTIEVVYISKVHYPNPILDMDLKLDQLGKMTLYSSSVDSKIGIHKLDKLYSDSNDCFFDTSNYYVNEGHDIIIRKSLVLGTDFIDTNSEKNGLLKKSRNYFILGTWSGVTCLMNNNNMITQRYLRSKSNIFVNESAIGNIEKTVESHKKVYKNTSLEYFDNLELNINAGKHTTSVVKFQSFSNRRRINTFLESFWVFIGYEDGCISMNKVE